MTAGIGVGPAAADFIVSDSSPAPQPYNLPSLGYQATQTSEFGNQVGLAGSARTLTTFTAYLSNWAVHAQYRDLPPDGYLHNFTLNLYGVDTSSATPGLGALFATKTQASLVPWRTETDPSCGQADPGAPGKWKAGDGNCYNGEGFVLTFDFTGENITLPDNLVFGLAYSTNTWGYQPIGAPGPYESLNFGLSSGVSIGTDVDPGDVFWNTKTATNYTDQGAAGVGTFRRDTLWNGYVPAVEIRAEAVPETASLTLLGLGLAGIATRLRKRA